MGHKIGKLTTFLVLFIGMIGCDYFEMRGFLLSYETADERFEQSMTWNNDHPFKVINVTNDHYILYVMGDSHLGTANNLNKFFHAAKNEQAIAAVMVGDLSTGSVENYEFLEQNIPHPDSLRTFLLVGNHDLYFDGWKQFYQRFGSGVYYFTVHTPAAKDLYICLDSGGGTLGEKQLKWFKALLEEHRDEYRFCVVFSHVNIFRIRNTLSTNPYPGEVLTLSHLCAENNVTMVFNGHDHLKNVESFGPTTFITMDALQDDLEITGYSKLMCNTGMLTFENVNF
ncbi:MAG: hypothetical protein CVU02_03020 [Bacteroidetes bacterium HGW-Bacteroidetes-19]|nr:MAG: hypothetical protein CVU04_03550 [Bacteroidetes bacterium HGW-Bacteroidetes-20]PKP27633.1 MAG: hypothetical protein CVU02_03020 [Bacteroidetes bacterium HGW-Bacteroidetes-19]